MIMARFWSGQDVCSIPVFFLFYEKGGKCSIYWIISSGSFKYRIDYNLSVNT